LALVLGARRTAAVVVCVAVVATGVGVALASAPDLGTYHCQNGSAPFGDLKLKQGGKYTWNNGSPGKYEYRASSKKVIFKTGVFHKDHWYGKHSRDPSDHSSVIKLYEQGQGFLGIRCYA
jgi:hypothetical protein